MNAADAAVAGRLSRLRTRPVELARLKSAVEQQVPRPQAEPSRRRFFIGGVGGTVGALVAASVILVLFLGVFGGPVQASPEKLVKLHQHVSQMGHSTHSVASWDAAEDVVEREWPACPMLPKIAGEQVTCCCVQKIGRKRVACVSLVADGKPVTMAVADADDVKGPGSGTREGAYTVHSRDGINMVMTNHGGRWICLMGEQSPERLLELAKSMK